MGATSITPSRGTHCGLTIKAVGKSRNGSPVDKYNRSGLVKWICRTIRARAAVSSFALVAAVAGCSLAMRGADPNWQSKKKPDCSESYTPVIIDAWIASFTAGTTALVVERASESHIEVPPVVWLGGLSLALLYTVSAAAGAHRYKSCRAATAAWHVRDALRARDASAERAGAETLAAAPRMKAVPLNTAGANAAFFCVHAERTALEICMRKLKWCEHARKVMAVRDGEVCAPHDTAWCLGETARCFVTPSGCETQRRKVGALSSTCIERR